MKKIALCSLIAVVTFGVAGTNNSAFGGDVNSACYAVKGTYLCPVVPPVPHSYCGGKTAAKWVGGIAGLGAGVAVGGAVGSIFGPYGTGAGVVAGGYAGAKLGAKIGTNYSANEYIYFEDGSCLECDSHDACEDFECPNRTVVTNGTKAYMCHVESSGDYWQEYTIPICADSERNINPKKKYKTYLKDNVTNNGKRVKDGVLVFSGSVCLYTEEVCPDCNDNKVAPKPDPVTPDPKPKKETKPNKPAVTPTPVKDECEQIGTSKDKNNYGGVENALKARACCYAGGTWDFKKNTCNCGEGKEWRLNPNKGVEGKGAMDCMVKESVEPTPCTKTNCKIKITQSVKCSNNDNYFDSIEEYPVCQEDLDALRLSCDGLKTKVNACQNTDCIKSLLTRIDAFDELIAKVCKPSGAPTPVVVPDNSAKIEAAKRTVSSFFGSAESNKSVWKDAEGNFNTARLASDLTAGVVLGTVGGVVSGVVIKKKQIEKGFDALHCSVGGQTVADWGDIFNVGLRR